MSANDICECVRVIRLGKTATWRHSNHLQGAVIHYGSLSGGHYVYVGKQNDKWYLFNDSSVSEIRSEDELKNLLSKAYWLYYKQN